MQGHTYSIVQVKEVYSHKLINIRNLWGFFEWDGAWGRRSAFWTPDIKEILNPKLDEDDGTFWMCFDDFARHFSALNVCKTKTAHEVRLKGKFIRVQEESKATDLVESKWFYGLEVTKKTNLQLGIHQIDEKIHRVLPRRRYLDTAFLVFKRTAEGTSLYDAQGFISGRDCEYEVNLEPGQYVILPRTNGIALKRPVNAAEEEISLLTPKGELSEMLEGAVEDIYYRFDTMISNSIDFQEFKEFYETVGQTITEPDFTAKVLGKFCSTDRGLTLKGLKDFWKEQVKALGEAEIWEWLKKLGYDREFYSSFSRSFILTMHSNQPLTLQVGDTVSTNLEEAAQSMILREQGQTQVNKPEVCLLSFPRK